MNQNVTTVVFDVGKVLFQWDLRYLFAKLIDDPADLDWFLANVITPEWHFQHDAGRTPEEIVAERRIEFPGHDSLFDAYLTRFNESIPAPVPGSLEIVHELANRGVPLFAITNFGHEFWHAFRPTQPIFNLFADIIVSGTEKMAKPDPAIYHLALQRFSLRAGEAIFIDDNLDNVTSARANGFVAHHFTDARNLRTELAKYGFVHPE